MTNKLISIRIGTTPKARTRARIEAMVIGPWAVHPARGRDGYSVTYIPFGMSIDSLAASLRPADAIRIARALASAPLKLNRAGTTKDAWLLKSIVGEALVGEPGWFVP